MPVIFFDEITVDSSGRVVDADAWPRLHDSAGTLAAKRAAITALRDAEQARRHALAIAEQAEQSAAFIANLERLPDGRVIGYKAVDSHLISSWNVAYPIGATVTAPDWKPSATCGGGLHFWPVPAPFAGSSRYLACAIDTAEMVIVHNDKIKARACEVLYEVDINGNRL
jgi:hypothetical protein